MAALSRRLQAQSPCFYQLQKLLPLHRHKMPEFLLGLVGPKAFLLLFLDRLLSRQGK